MCVGETLNMDSCSIFLGNLEGIWGNPGEIPHIGWKIPRVYRDKEPELLSIPNMLLLLYVHSKWSPCYDVQILRGRKC